MVIATVFVYLLTPSLGISVTRPESVIVKEAVRFAGLQIDGRDTTVSDITEQN